MRLKMDINWEDILYQADSHKSFNLQNKYCFCALQSSVVRSFVGHASSGAVIVVASKMNCLKIKWLNENRFNVELARSGSSDGLICAALLLTPGQKNGNWFASMPFQKMLVKNHRSDWMRSMILPEMISSLIGVECVEWPTLDHKSSSTHCSSINATNA